MQSEPKEKIDGILFLSKRIQFLRHELWQKEDEIEQLQKHVLETQSQLNKKERSDFKDGEILKLNEEIKELRWQSDSKDDEILKLKEENNELRLQSDSKYHEMLRVKDENNELRRQLAESHEIDTDQQGRQQDSQNDTQTGALVELVVEKLKSGLKEIQENVIDLIDDKLKISNAQSQSMIDNMTHKQTYSNAVKSMKPGVTNNLRAIMIETTNDEIAEELDRQSRVNNIIIHGKKEDDSTDDKAFAENLLKEQPLSKRSNG